MITLFKIFENVNNGNPEVGDYVICKNDYFGKQYEDFISNNIGIVHSIEMNDEKTVDGDTIFYIMYDDVPDFMKWLVFKHDGVKTLSIYMEDIKYFSKNKDEIQLKLSQNKYNL